MGFDPSFALICKWDIAFCRGPWRSAKPRKGKISRIEAEFPRTAEKANFVCWLPNNIPLIVLTCNINVYIFTQLSHLSYPTVIKHFYCSFFLVMC